jgi:hypothetical protein
MMIKIILKTQRHKGFLLNKNLHKSYKNFCAHDFWQIFGDFCPLTLRAFASLCSDELKMVDADALLVPLVEAVDTFVNLYLMMPAKTMKFLYIGELLQRAVGLRGIPTDFALETDFLPYQLGQLTDADFLASAYVDMAISDFGNAVGILHVCIVSVLEIHVQ